MAIGFTHGDFGAQESKVCHCFPDCSIYCHEVMRQDATILVFWMLNFEPAFSLSCFTFIKRLFRSSLLYAIRVVSSPYLRLLIFLPAILITTCDSSSLALCMVCTTEKLNKQVTICSLVVLLSQFWSGHCFMCIPCLSGSNCCFLNDIQVSQEAVRWSDLPTSLRVFHSL